MLDENYDRTKLPQWAQRELTRLDADVEHWRKLATAGERESNTFLIMGFEVDSEKALPENARIKFQLPSGEVQVHVRYDEVRIQTNPGQMLVAPQASNSVHVKVAPIDW